MLKWQVVTKCFFNLIYSIKIVKVISMQKYWLIRWYNFLTIFLVQLFLADQIMAKLFSIYSEYQPISSGIKKVELKNFVRKNGALAVTRQKTSWPAWRYIDTQVKDTTV